MIDYHNPYIRLQSYYSLLANDVSQMQVDDTYTLGLPIQQLHAIMNIPVEVIRQDICSLFQWVDTLEFDEDSQAYIQAEKDYALDDLYDQINEANFPESLKALLLGGHLDHIPLHLIRSNEIHYRVTLSPEEAKALHSYQSDLGTKDSTLSHFDQTIHSGYQIKDSYRFNHNYDHLHDKLDTINQAIKDSACLYMTYKTAKGKKLSIHFMPLKIGYDSVENLYVVLSIYRHQVKVHRLDRIQSLQKSPRHMKTPDLHLLDRVPHIWGFSFSEKAYPVKVRFRKDANVWEKVRKDLYYRTKGKLYESDGYLYYEDIVYGINKFRTWIYGYGSSAIVLEPLSLRQEIIASLLERKEYYDDF